jgi:hypothetical protein
VYPRKKSCDHSCTCSVQNHAPERLASKLPVTAPMSLVKDTHRLPPTAAVSRTTSPYGVVITNAYGLPAGNVLWADLSRGVWVIAMQVQALIEQLSLTRRGVSSGAVNAYARADENHLVSSHHGAVPVSRLYRVFIRNLASRGDDGGHHTAGSRRRHHDVAAGANTGVTQGLPKILDSRKIEELIGHGLRLLCRWWRVACSKVC